MWALAPGQDVGWAPWAPGVLGLFLLSRGPSVVGGWTTHVQEMIFIDTWAKF